jgi:hypothetical protein
VFRDTDNLSRSLERTDGVSHFSVSPVLVRNENIIKEKPTACVVIPVPVGVARDVLLLLLLLVVMPAVSAAAALLAAAEHLLEDALELGGGAEGEEEEGEEEWVHGCIVIQSWRG